MMSGMYQRFQRNHLVELSSYPHQTVLQLDQTKTFHDTNSLTARSNFSIAMDQFPFVKPFKMQKYEMFAWVLSSYSTFKYRAHLDKCLVQPVVIRSSIRPQFILLPIAPGITQALVTQIHSFCLVYKTISIIVCLHCLSFKLYEGKSESKVPYFIATK